MPMTIPEQVIQSLIVWIDENIHRQLHIDDIAKHAGYSKWHLQRIFVHYRGETLARYVRSRRLEIIAEELLHSDKRVLDICLKYGFESQQTFTRIFTRHFKQPPSLWRKTHQHDELAG